MKLKVICVAYERPIPLLGLICSFVCQTNPNWELYIIYDGEVPEDIKAAKSFIQDDRIFFSNTEKVNGNWGHPNRKIALESIQGEASDYVLITNDDNYYVTSFVDQMLSAAEFGKIGMVACYTSHSYNFHAIHHSEIRENGIDMGAFIVRLDVAKWVGFNYVHISADGAYAEECRDHCANEGLRIVMIPRPLFVHN